MAPSHSTHSGLPEPVAQLGGIHWKQVSSPVFKTPALGRMSGNPAQLWAVADSRQGGSLSETPSAVHVLCTWAQECLVQQL